MVRYSRNSHGLQMGRGGIVYVLSDLHWDNPHCDRKLLKKHLDKAEEDNAHVIIIGDLFCLMQGRYDPRRSKKDILPEHNKPNYLDVVVEDAVNFFAPYAKNLALVSYGNHETAIVKNVETDPLQRFVTLLNHECGTSVELGGYGGWVTFRFDHGGAWQSKSMYYFHGSGGGGAVTKGVIQNQRQMADTDGADIIAMGHVHELYTMWQSKKALNGRFLPIIRNVLHIRTGTYKDEHGDGFMGWHIERGAPAKPLGCVKLTFSFLRDRTKGAEFQRFIDVVPEMLTN